MTQDVLARSRETLLSAVVDSLDDAMVVFDTGGRVVTANPSMERLTGLDLTDSIGLTLLELRRTEFMEVNADGIESLHAFVLHVAGSGEPLFDDDNTRLDPGGRRVRVSRRLTPVRLDDEVVGVLLVIRDLASVHSSLFRNAAVGMARLDWRGAIREVNLAFERLVGRGEEALYGTPFSALLDPADQDSAQARLDGLGEGHVDRFQVEQRFLRPDGSIVWGSTTAALAGIANQKGRAAVVVVEDISDRKRLEAMNAELRESERNLLESLAWEASHDALTSLTNRRGFVDVVEHALATTSPPASIGLLFIDLDGFKAINDVHGHEVGDAVLVEVGRRIRSCTRAHEVVARLGGDEFTVLLHDAASAPTADAVAERIRRAVAEPIAVGDLELAVTASVGAVVHEGPPCAPGELLRQADVAMYAVKQRRCSSAGSRP